MSFHEIRFPTRISFGSAGGPERRTDIVVLGSGYEERNTRWADSRRRYNAGTGVKTLDDLHEVTAFFEERRGALYGFRWKDHWDFKSCAPSESPSENDQTIGIGDGATSGFQLKKIYGSSFAPYDRFISKPVAGTVLIAIDSVPQSEGSDYSLDATIGLITFDPGNIPPNGANVTAGFEFDVPVRFDTDRLEVDLVKFEAGAIQNIAIVEIRI